MELLKGISTLIKRFFFGTPEGEVNYNNVEVKKMEAKYLRYQLYNECRKNKALELKNKLLELKTV